MRWLDTRREVSSELNFTASVRAGARLMMAACLPKTGDVLLGKYSIHRVLGTGGMGAVMAATHVELDQEVAIKFMLPGLAHSDAMASRFLREARAAVSIKSDHVCRVLDVGRTPETAA